MEIVIQGEGEVVIRLIDQAGHALGERKIRLSGSERIQGKTELPIFLETGMTQTSVAPVVVRHEDNQKVLFDGEEARVFTKKRCQEIGCSPTVIEDVLRGCVASVQNNEMLVAGTELARPKRWWGKLCCCRERK
jgi:hypothetical protein